MGYYPPGSSGGGLTLVGEQVIAGAAAANFTFAGLNGNLDGIYELWWWMEARVGTAVRMFLQPNALETDQTSTWTFTAGTPGNPASNNELGRLSAAHGMQRDTGWGRLTFFAKTGTFRSMISTWGEGALSAGGNYDRMYSEGMWRDDSTNVTSLVLATALITNASVAGWGIGSHAQLWKRPF